MKRCKLFRGVESGIIGANTPDFRVRNVKTGGVIFRAGTRGRHLYVIESGKVGVRTATANGKPMAIETLTAGEVFGELDIVDGGRRSADTFALTKCRLILIPRKTFLSMLQSSRKLERNLLRMVTGRLRQGIRIIARLEDEHVSSTRARLRRFESLMDAAYLVHSSLNLRTLLSIILDTAVELVNAGRGTLYLIDEEKHELCSRVATGSKSIDIRLALGEGIAGHVARTGEVVNLADAYSDPRFNPEVDRISGYVSRTMLCMPLTNGKGATIGVVQLLNKSAGRFDREDETFIAALSVHAATAIENARLAERMIGEERLSAVGRMAGAIVHDIKNPLNTLRLSAEFIAGKTGDPDVEHVTGIMINQIDRFDSMAQEILEFSRGTTSLKIRSVGIGEILRTVEEIYGAELKKKGVSLRRRLGFRGEVEVDFDKIVRCLQNIVGNALDVIPRDGTIGITTGRRGPFFRIDVTDNGPGIPEEIVSRIFEPFVTRKKKHGTGLGLAIVKKIVRDHGGTVEVASAPGKGTKLSLFLPVKARG